MGGPGLDHTTFIMCAEFVTIHIAEVNLYSRQSAGEPLQSTVHFGFNEPDQLGIDRNVSVTVDLNLHAFPP